MVDRKCVFELMSVPLMPLVVDGTANEVTVTDAAVAVGGFGTGADDGIKRDFSEGMRLGLDMRRMIPSLLLIPPTEGTTIACNTAIVDGDVADDLAVVGDEVIDDALVAGTIETTDAVNEAGCTVEADALVDIDTVDGLVQSNIGGAPV